ncbi:IlvD/Edd family dehydratase [Hyphococcus luteus]|uniref:Dihydroxy-acid dehydratase n=1 Tax=Hyphococcus luteus TaxID=2058213 RepID=A0A2S7KAS8_9PROT|nr:IlvD/Edd family dehydratase [Marinicaulis flavus]PQA89587.1 dihydroxy-acid dehydratase [Marinicaulis flavus]
MTEKKKDLRSRAWFGGADKPGFMHRSWMKNQGFPAHQFKGKPVIGICNTWSELTPCNAHLRQVADRVKQGVYEAGGFPLEFPVFSNGEALLRPTAMLTRNLASMDVEESIRGNPIDGVVLLVGCDKTTPALVMGAASCDAPAIVVSGGPMLNGRHKGEIVGSGTTVWRLSEQMNAGAITAEEFMSAEESMSRSAGSCNTMGTASTMASMVEALGLSLPHNAAIPAVDSRRYVLAHMSGMRIVDMVKEGLKISDVATRASFLNAIRANAAIGGSTNAVIHLIAMARRMGVELSLDDWQTHGRDVPTIVNLVPSGKYLMEDFYYAGGLPVVLRRLGEAGLLDKESRTVNGHTIWENVKDASCYNEDVIKPMDAPLAAHGGVAILRGNISPRGAVLKPSAATPALMKHRGRAVVFENYEDYHARIADPDLDIDESCVMVLKNCGPKGYPGMPEVGNMGLPPKLLKKGVTDMVRISDARMSGTAYGTVVLHVSPEAADGGPLAAIEDGDIIDLDVEKGTLSVALSNAEIEARLKARKTSAAFQDDGYAGLYQKHVLQADEGCDFDFLVGCRGAGVPADSH